MTITEEDENGQATHGIAGYDGAEHKMKPLAFVQGARCKSFFPLRVHEIFSVISSKTH